MIPDGAGFLSRICRAVISGVFGVFGVSCRGERLLDFFDEVAHFSEQCSILTDT